MGYNQLTGFPHGSDSKESTYNAGDPGLNPGYGKSHGQKNLVGYGRTIPPEKFHALAFLVRLPWATHSLSQPINNVVTVSGKW